jgi:hypothetical protein
MPAVLEMPNRSAGKLFNLSKFLQFIGITILLAAIILVGRLEYWNNGMLEYWVWRNEIYFKYK